MTKRPALPITLPEYERIFRVIHGALLGEDADIPRSCLFFAIAGAAILNVHHRLPAQVVVGSAAYKLSNTGKAIIAFGMSADCTPQPGLDKFHAWVQVDDWHIDFTAPLFREMYETMGQANTLARKMFQKRLPEEGRLDSVGDFITVHDDALTMHYRHDFFRLPAMGDLVLICAEWYRRPPREIQPMTGVADQHGMIRAVPLSPLRLTGVW